MGVLGRATAGTDWEIKVENLRIGECVSVRSGGLPDPDQRDLVPLRVQSSRDWKGVGLSEDDYEERFIAEHDRRCRSGAGATKGRVLYLRGNQSPLAVVTWSRPTDVSHPLVIRGAAAASVLTGEDAIGAVELVFQCLLAVSEEMGRPKQLAWNPRVGDEAHQKRTTQLAHEIFDFHGIKHKPQYTRGKHYLRRPKTVS